jgi:transcriptional regulator with XRE-family HTH domain
VITGAQIRAARGFLAWDRRDLAKKAVVTIYTVERIERGTGTISDAAMAKGLTAIKAALEAEGIEFTDDKGVLGVRLRPRKRRK